MKRLTKRDIQRHELNILIAVKEICNSHNLKFYLAGGTLLGAIRHRGFIPWDDDIDICMPRPDYEKFISLWPKMNQIYVLKSDRLNNWDAPFTKVIDPTTQIESVYDERKGSLWIDVFPVDGLPSDVKKVENVYKQCNFYRKLLMIAHARLGEGTSQIHKYGKYILKPIAKLIGTDYFSKKLEKIACQIPYESAKYVGIVTWGLYGVGERMLKSEFEKEVEVEFEGYKMPAFSCWDSYLHGIYGNYMQLPPLEKRQTHDMIVYKKE